MLTLDLEFYKPECDQHGYNGINLIRPRHILLGGYFTVRNYPDTTRSANHHSLWIWNFASEEKLVKAIFNVFEDYYQKKHDKAHQAAYVGVGISRFDLPSLTILFHRYKITSEEHIIEIMKFATHVDLSACGAVFNCSPFVRNISHTKLYQYLIGESSRKDNSKKVWQYYENYEYEKISERTKNEVLEIEQMFEELSKITKDNYNGRNT